MKLPDHPANEKERLAALKRYGILDTLPEIVFDDLSALASQICNTPIALITLLDESRQWFKSKIGIDATETSREISFCGHAILQNDLFEVQNTLDDPNFFDNPLVTASPNIRFYAGMPLKSSEGFILGTLCVIDTIPRQLSEKQREALKKLSRQVVSQIEARDFAKKNYDLNNRLNEKIRFITNITNALPAMVAYWDKELCCRFVNNLYLEVLNKKADEVIGNAFKAVLPSEYYEQAHAHALIALEGKRQSFELNCATPDGHKAIGQVNYVPDFDENQQVVGFLVLVNDITSIRKAEEEQKLTASLFQNISEATIIADAEHTFLSVNTRFTTMTGYTAEEAIGKNASLLASKKNDPAIHAEIFGTIERNQYWQGDIFSQKKNGESYLIHLTVKALVNNEGKVTHHIATMLDLTETQKIKSDLVITSEMLQRTGSMAKIGGWELDCETNKITWSNEIFRIHELDAMKVPDLEKALSFFPPEARPVVVNAIEKCMQYQIPWDFETPFITAKGNRRWTRSQGQALMKNGKVTRLVGAFQDVTERKQLEDQRLAKEIELRNNLVREVHHRIKNNLQGVTGILHNFIINQPSLSAPLLDAISQLQSVAIIHGLQAKTSQANIELSELIHEIIHHVQRIWQIKIHLDIPQPWLTTYISKNEKVPIALILNELFTNAIKHKETNSDIKISLTQSTMPNICHVNIFNVGAFVGKSNPYDSHSHHFGLSLVTSLMPKNGAYLQWILEENATCVQFKLSFPVISFEPPHAETL